FRRQADAGKVRVRLRRRRSWIGRRLPRELFVHRALRPVSDVLGRKMKEGGFRHPWTPRMHRGVCRWRGFESPLEQRSLGQEPNETSQRSARIVRKCGEYVFERAPVAAEIENLQRKRRRGCSNPGRVVVRDQIPIGPVTDDGRRTAVAPYIRSPSSGFGSSTGKKIMNHIGPMKTVFCRSSLHDCSFLMASFTRSIARSSVSALFCCSMRSITSLIATRTKSKSRSGGFVKRSAIICLPASATHRPY